MLNLWTAVSAEFPGVRNVGIDCCRRIKAGACDPTIDTGRGWSQHAYGNALDIGVPDRATGDRVYSWLIRNRLRFGLGTICWRDRGGCNAADHQDHIHVEGPKMSGTPECAGGSFQGTRPGLIGLTDADSSPFSIGGLSVTNPFEAIGALFTPEPWLRAILAISGVALTGYALVLFMRELGVTPPLPSTQLAQLLGGTR